jgi:hypothetical protein
MVVGFTGVQQVTRFDYATEILPIANELIDEFGKDAVLVKPGEPESDADQFDPPPEPDESDIVVVETRYSLTHRDQTLINQGDKIWLVSAAGAIPLVGDKITLGGVSYTIHDSQPLAPGPINLLFKVHARA